MTNTQRTILLENAETVETMLSTIRAIQQHGALLPDESAQIDQLYAALKSTYGILDDLLGAE